MIDWRIFVFLRKLWGISEHLGDPLPARDHFARWGTVWLITGLALTFSFLVYKNENFNAICGIVGFTVAIFMGGTGLSFYFSYNSIAKIRQRDHEEERAALIPK